MSTSLLNPLTAPRTSSAATSSLVVQAARYLVVGGVAFVADVSSLALLKEWFAWHYLSAAAAGFVVGLIVNYVLSIGWVFDRRSVDNPRMEFILFAVIGLAGLGMSELMLWGLVQGLSLQYLAAKCLAAGAVLVWNFIARKTLLFH